MGPGQTVKKVILVPGRMINVVIYCREKTEPLVKR